MVKLKPVQQITYDISEATAPHNTTYLMFPLEHITSIEFLVENMCTDEVSPEEVVECIHAIRRYETTFKQYYGM